MHRHSRGPIPKIDDFNVDVKTTDFGYLIFNCLLMSTALYINLELKIKWEHRQMIYMANLALVQRVQGDKKNRQISYF